MDCRPRIGRSRLHAISWLGWLACGLSLVTASSAQALDVPALRGHVNDLAKMLAPDRAAALEARLAAHEQGTSQQFALLTIPSLEGGNIEEYSIRVAENWKLGSKTRDQGLILVVSAGDRKVRIEVGHGLEGVIPDAVAARISREIITPAFKQGDYAGGIDAAFNVLMQLGSGDESAMPAAPRPAARPRSAFGPLLFPALLFLLFSLFSRFFGGGGRGGRRRGGAFIPPIFWGGGGGGGWGGGSGGGFGGGGGGYSGGGGSFGGGGASGDW
jgi:uncharacterized protein